MEKPKKKLSVGILIAIAAAAAVVIGAAAGLIFVPMRTEKLNAEEYAYAQQLEDSGEQHKAALVYDDLGDYSDSAGRAAECRSYVAYTEAESFYAAEDYTEALARFSELGDYSDSAQKAADCKNIIDYAAAAEKYAAGDYAEAEKLFASLGSYMDSEDMAVLSGRYEEYTAAKALYDAGESDAAAEALKPLAKIMFADSYIMYDNCISQSIYEQALELYDNELYYSASALFKSIQTYKDSEELMYSCSFSEPESGILYKNSAYTAEEVIVSCKNTNQSAGIELRVYDTVKNTVVLDAYIHAGETLSFSLPAGSFSFKLSYGFIWYGRKEGFGDDGDHKLFLPDGADKKTFVAGDTLDIDVSLYVSSANTRYIDPDEFMRGIGDE